MISVDRISFSAQTVLEQYQRINIDRFNNIDFKREWILINRSRR